MVILGRLFGIVLVTWLLWQLDPVWAMMFLVLYWGLFIIWHVYNGFAAINWRCPEPWDFDTWQYMQGNKWRDTKSHEEQVYWYNRYMDGFPEGTRVWNRHEDNPYG